MVCWANCGALLRVVVCADNVVVKTLSTAANIKRCMGTKINLFNHNPNVGLDFKGFFVNCAEKE